MCSKRLQATLLRGCFLDCLACAAPSQRHGGQLLDIAFEVTEVDGYASMVQSHAFQLEREVARFPLDDRRTSSSHEASLQELLFMAQQSSTVHPQAAAAVEETKKAAETTQAPLTNESKSEEAESLPHESDTGSSLSSILEKFMAFEHTLSLPTAFMLWTVVSTIFWLVIGSLSYFCWQVCVTGVSSPQDQNLSKRYWRNQRKDVY
eukprot:TRINITY_DN102418_c0_g1_i1.p1 TRINITY_DN102418_c0_g1~~TRINITY_DN102418_c0_g1_i1.p1  ORF type:complete len:206 (-),score=39.39 TRINITY_DN102418_c0_g1_i1:149-766(-)